MVSVLLLILLLQSNLTTTATPGDKAQGHLTTVFCKISVWRIFCCLNTVNDLLNTRGVYLTLGVQEGAFNRWEVFKRVRRLYSRSLF